MELSPRTAPGGPGEVAPRRRRSPWAYGALVLVLVGLGVVAYQGLTSASLYFYNADEAVMQREALGDKRFNLQGLVVTKADPTPEGVEFTVTFNNETVKVRHAGDPPELFQVGIPVVLEGHWSQSDDVFESDRILVKHSEQYEADNGDRLDDAKDGEPGDASSP